MLRLPRLLLFVVLVASGCQELRGCGASEPAPPVTATPAPAAPTPSVAPPPPEARYARRWLVILHSSPTPGTRTEVVAVLAALAKTGLPAEPDRLSSNAFRNLRPCLEVVVARAFAEKAKAEDFQTRLAAAGVAAYVKNAGPLDPDRERKEATCRAEAEAAAARMEAQRHEAAPRLVEVHDGRTFMLLGKVGDNAGLSPLDGSRRLWMAPAETDPTGQFTRGTTVDLYGTTGPLRSEGALRAEQVQEKLKQDVRATRYSAGEGQRQVVFAVARFVTGEGNSACGSDYHEQLTRAVVLGSGGEQRVLTANDLNGDEVAGVMDLEGDGQVELLLHATWPAQRVRLIREDGTELAGTEVENCDCGC